MWMKWSQTAWEAFLGYATQKRLMLLASWSQAIWMKLALWSVRSRQTAPSAWWKSVVGTLWWLAANVSPFWPAMAIPTLSFLDLFLRIWHGAQTVLLFQQSGILSLMVDLPTKKKQKALGSVQATLWSLKALLSWQPIRKTSFPKLGITVMGSWWSANWHKPSLDKP